MNLVVHLSYPFMGASLAGVVSYELYGSNFVDIKYSQSYKDNSFLEATGESTFISWIKSMQ